MLYFLYVDIELRKQLIYLCIYFLQVLRQDLDNHLHGFMQQHLLLLLNDSVENKKRFDELFTIEN